MTHMTHMTRVTHMTHMTHTDITHTWHVPRLKHMKQTTRMTQMTHIWSGGSCCRGVSREELYPSCGVSLDLYWGDSFGLYCRRCPCSGCVADMSERAAAIRVIIKVAAHYSGWTTNPWNCVFGRATSGLELPRATRSLPEFIRILILNFFFRNESCIEKLVV